MNDTARSYYFGTGTRRHEAVSRSADGWITMRCGISGKDTGPAKKVWSSRIAPNCRACRAAAVPPEGAAE